MILMIYFEMRQMIWECCWFYGADLLIELYGFAVTLRRVWVERNYQFRQHMSRNVTLLAEGVG